MTLLVEKKPSWLSLPAGEMAEFPLETNPLSTCQSERRFCVASQAFLNSFDHLPRDQYALAAQRYRRFSQFMVAFRGCGWQLTLLPHKAFVQYDTDNQVIEGATRNFEPLLPDCDVTPYINKMATLFKQDASRQYHINVHQYRVRATLESSGTSVPEGWHYDGVEYVAVLVFRRHNITRNSATFEYRDSQTNEILHTTIAEGRGIVFRDRLHNATPIIAADASGGSAIISSSP